MSNYRIIDEPHIGFVRKLVVNPLFPMLFTMLIGSTCGYLWFLINSLSLKQSFPQKELRLIGLGLLFSFLYGSLSIYLINEMNFHDKFIKYLLFPLTLNKLAIAYYLYINQSGDYEAQKYFDESNQVNSWPIIIGTGLILYKINMLIISNISGLLILRLMVK